MKKIRNPRTIDLIREEKKIEKEEEKIEKEEEKIEQLILATVIKNEHIYEKILELERKIVGEDNFKFIHIDEWKTYIWNNCKFKKGKESTSMILYFCLKKNKPCHFIGCPLNTK
ncbi:MAG: hypothetical protein KJ583_03510 [Nanoarchaeota archaeon]|nr:hypothetical protein [Nanoarchaeota archaeon]MBU1269769.1 hypothetical protein [Nanoarchaeota archaeon]MBU1604361.1 hypothetical protein [Nanoarchaeota archaeon]MBU2443383.1 hypothetical protein [Nanoarchaeota archaeon]